MTRTLAVLLVLPVAGCPIARVCTDMFVPDTLTITVEAADWEPGTWVVLVEARVCTLTLPGGDDLACADGLSLQLTGDGAGIASLTTFELAPETAEIVFEHDGDEVFREGVTPVYEEDEPNGKGCGVSLYGVATVTLPGA